MYILLRNQDSEALSMGSIELSLLVGQMSAPFDSENSQNTQNSAANQNSAAAQDQQTSSELSQQDVITPKKTPNCVQKSPTKAVTPSMLFCCTISKSVCNSLLLYYWVSKYVKACHMTK